MTMVIRMRWLLFFMLVCRLFSKHFEFPEKKLSRFVLTFLNPRKNSCTSPLNFTNFKTSLHLGIILRFLMERNRLRRSVSTILNLPLKAGKFVWITNNILNYLRFRVDRAFELREISASFPTSIDSRNNISTVFPWKSSVLSRSPSVSSAEWSG